MTTTATMTTKRGSSKRSKCPDRNLSVEPDIAFHERILASWARLDALPSHRRLDALRPLLDDISDRAARSALRGSAAHLLLLLAQSVREGKRPPTQRQLSLLSGLSDASVRYGVALLLKRELITVEKLGIGSPVMLVVDERLVEEATNGR